MQDKPEERMANLIEDIVLVAIEIGGLSETMVTSLQEAIEILDEQGGSDFVVQSLRSTLENAKEESEYAE